MKARINLVSIILFALGVAMLLAACGSSEEASESGSSGDTSGAETTETTSQGSTEPTTEEEELTPAEATVSPNEDVSMVPAGGEEPDPAQPPPENPPEGVETYPATNNDLVEGDVDYERTPPTNGPHDKFWQNCGFYEEPIRNEHAVHSLDHGVVWITHKPDLPQEQIQTLRSYSDEEYVIVSPYPDQPAPVTVTAWRNQLRLQSAGDERLSQFVEQFRISETAPLSGNGCTGGIGRPA